MKPYNKFVTIFLCCIIGLFTLLNILVIPNIIMIEQDNIKSNVVFIASFGSIGCTFINSVYISGKHKFMSSKKYWTAFFSVYIMLVFNAAASYIAIFLTYR